MKKKIFSLFLLLFIACFTLSHTHYQQNQTLDTHMSPTDKENAGMQKLTPQEKQYLQDWINKHHYVRPGSRKHHKKHPEISEVIAQGSYLKLSDGSLWQVEPTHRLLTQSWISAAEILIEKKGSGRYPYTLKNMVTGTTIRAAKVQHLPRYLQRPPQQRSHSRGPNTAKLSQNDQAPASAVEADKQQSAAEKLN